MHHLCARQMRAPGISKVRGKKNILALAPDRFVGDLQILDKSEKFSVSRMPHYWHYAVMDLVGRGGYHLDNPERVNICKNFLLSLRSIYDFECVIGACLWYRQDMPWAEAATLAGIPFILLHKEGLKTELAQLEQLAYRAKLYGPFKGTHVVVHNEIFRKTLIDAGYASPDQVSSLGAMRMDRLARVTMEKDKEPPRKQAVLFSFPHRADGSLPDQQIADQSGPFPTNPYLGWVRLFESTHTAFARAAIALPNAEFIIKLKWEEGWADRVQQALNSNGLSVADIPNLTIDFSSDPHDLIIGSQVVCGFNSTTVLEAGVFDKTVIIPIFDEAVRPDYEKAVKYRDVHHLFDVVKSPGSLTDTVVRRLQIRKVTSRIILEERRRLFERLISPLDGKVSERYIELIDRLT